MHVRTPSAGTLGGLQAVLPVVAGPCRERRKPKPMMNGLKESDEAVRPATAANKGAHAPAEPPEKGLNQGETGRPKHAPDAVPGKRGTGGRPDTASCRVKPEGASYGALPPCHAGGARCVLLRVEAGRGGWWRRRDVGDVRRRSVRAAARPPPPPAQRGSVPGAGCPAGGDTQAGRRDTTARDRGAGGQDRPESGCGRDPDASLRGR